MLAIASGFFALVATYFLYDGFLVQVVVPTTGGDVANLQLMHVQSLDISLGIGATVVSAIFAIGAAIVGQIRRG
jgi:TRAP-type uncharacterized transport system substrate-binding protein